MRRSFLENCPDCSCTMFFQNQQCKTCMALDNQPEQAAQQEWEDITIRVKKDHQCTQHGSELEFNGVRYRRIAPDTVAVTKGMILSAQVAEFKHYHPNKKMTDMCWQGTPSMLIKKMIEAALKGNDGI